MSEADGSSDLDLLGLCIIPITPDEQDPSIDWNRRPGGLIWYGESSTDGLVLPETSDSPNALSHSVVFLDFDSMVPRREEASEVEIASSISNFEMSEPNRVAMERRFGSGTLSSVRPVVVE